MPMFAGAKKRGHPPESLEHPEVWGFRGFEGGLGFIGAWGVFRVQGLGLIRV